MFKGLGTCRVIRAALHAAAVGVGYSLFAV